MAEHVDGAPATRSHTPAAAGSQTRTGTGPLVGTGSLVRAGVRSRAHSRKRSGVLAVVATALAGALLSGCTGPSGEPAAGAGAEASVAPVPAAEQPSAGAGASDPDGGSSAAGSDDFPSCDEVKAALGPEVAGLVELAGSENGVATGSDGSALGCAWHTPETAEGSTDLVEYGGISVGVSRDDSYTEESMQPLGSTVDDARVSAAGAWALKVGGGYDPAAQLDVTGVQVVRDGVVVVLTSGGVALQDVPQLASLTNDWALGAGVAVLDLTD